MRRWLLGFLFVGCARLAAQIQFTVYTWPQQGVMTSGTALVGLPQLVYQDDRGTHPFQPVRGQLTPAQRYTGPAPLRLYEVLPAPPPAEGDPKTEPLLRLYATVQFNPRWQEVNILLFPERRSPETGVQNVALDFNPARAPVGKATLYNGSRQTVAFSVKGQAHTLAPGERKVLNRSEVEEEREQGLSAFRLMVGRQDAKGRWRTLYSNNHFLEPDRRCLFVVMEYGNRLQVQHISALPSASEP